MNKKEERSLYLDFLTKQAKRKAIDRRDFIKATMALGLTATSALLLFQACGGDAAPTAAPVAPTAAPATAAAPAPGGETPATAAPVAAPDTGEAPPPTAPPATAGTADSGDEEMVLLDPGGLDHLVRRLPELTAIPQPNTGAWTVLEGKNTVFISLILTHPWHQAANVVFAEEFERLGMTYQGLDSNFDAAREGEHMDLALSRGYDAILLASADPGAGAANVRRARESGKVIFIMWDATLARPSAAWIYAHYQTVALGVNWLGATLPPGSKVFGAVGELVSLPGVATKASFLEHVKQYDLEVLAFEDGHGWTQEGGYAMGQAAFARFPQIDAIWGGDDQSALGFHKAAVDAGRRDDVIIVGQASTKVGQDAIREGRLDASVSPRRGHGPEQIASVDLVEALLRGNIHADAMQAMHIIKNTMVTRENLDEQWHSPF
jgi:ABC-type sugar transport system substrate-binding protein